MSDPQVELKQLVGNVLAAASSQPSGPFCDALRDALNALAGSGQLAEGRRAVASQLAKVTSPWGLGIWRSGWEPESKPGSIPSQPPCRSSMRCCGGFVRCRRLPLPGDPGRLEPLGQGLVAHLARSPSHRTYLQAREDWIAELERAESFSPGPGWVLELLRKQSGQLVVLHLEQRRGFQVTYENLSNCFHLFTLLQAALVGKVSDARGRYQVSGCRSR